MCLYKIGAGRSVPKIGRGHKASPSHPIPSHPTSQTSRGRSSAPRPCPVLGGHTPMLGRRSATPGRPKGGMRTDGECMRRVAARARVGVGGGGGFYGGGGIHHGVGRGGADGSSVSALLGVEGGALEDGGPAGKDEVSDVWAHTRREGWHTIRSDASAFRCGGSAPPFRPHRCRPGW